MEVLRWKASMVGLDGSALMKSLDGSASMEGFDKRLRGDGDPDGKLRWKASTEGFLGSALTVGLDGNVSMEGLEARLSRRDPAGSCGRFRWKTSRGVFRRKGLPRGGFDGRPGWKRPDQRDFRGDSMDSFD